MQIGFDGTVLIAPRTGIGYYTHFLLQHLQADPSLSLFSYNGLFMRPYVQGGPAAEKSSSLRSVAAGLKQFPGSRRAYRLLKRANFSRAARNLDIFHATNYLPPSETTVPVLPLIHDVSHIRHPEWHPAERVRWLNSGARQFASAPIVNTVSEFSAREITATLGIDPSRIRVTFPGVNPLYRKPPPLNVEAFLRRLSIRPGHYFLCVGTLEPRKNLTTALTAYIALPSATREHFPLVIVGPGGWGDLGLPAESDRLITDGQVRFTGYLTEQDMHVLYHEATALLFPSSYEGFGMPVSEAMATGTRTIVASGGAPEEVAQGLGLALPAFDVWQWREGMLRAIDEKWHADQALRERLRSSSQLFDWEATASETLSLYRGILT